MLGLYIFIINIYIKLPYIKCFFTFVLALGLILLDMGSIYVENINVLFDMFDSTTLLLTPPCASLSKEIQWKSELQDHYKKHHQVVKFIQEGKEPSVEFLEQILEFKAPSRITKQHLALCSAMYDKRVTMPLPLPHTEHVEPFTALVGQERYGSKIIRAGCYMIKGPNLANSPVTNLVSTECYIGQSTHLGHRVKAHTKGDSTICDFIESLKDKGVLELCILTDEIEIPVGLTKNQFITLLEQYLIIKLKPTVNKKFIATPGIMWTIETIKTHQDKMSIPIYVYKKEVDHMILIQVFSTTRSVGLDLGMGKSFYSSVRSRTSGWYKNIILFSEVELVDCDKNILSLLEFKELIENLRETRIGFGVRVTNVITGEVVDYDSMQAVSRAIGIDSKGIKDKSLTGKLYKKMWQIKHINS